MRPMPVGADGEIYIGGVGVARGYLNRPELTAERFLADPFRGDPRARMYKTGDLGRWRSDQTIECLGRNDQQVKIRGYRIELGEVESQLMQYPRVKDAVVIAGEDLPAQKRLVAYIVLKELSGTQEPPNMHALSAFLRERLPEYMIPSFLVILDRLPLTPNGKLDRHKLPPPEHVSREYEAPQGAVEKMLAGVWQNLLRIERVGRHDDFFELGGHSLIAMQLMVRMRSSLSIDIPIRLVFEFPTLKTLSAQVDNLRQKYLLNNIAGGGRSIEELLERVNSMSDSKVQELMRELMPGGDNE